MLFYSIHFFKRRAGLICFHMRNYHDSEEADVNECFLFIMQGSGAFGVVNSGTSVVAHFNSTISPFVKNSL